MDYFVWDLMTRSLDALPSLFVLSLSWLAIQLSDFITAGITSERLRMAYERLDDAAFVAAREVEQTAVRLIGAWPGDTLGTVDRGAANARVCLGMRGWSDLGRTLGLSSEELDRALRARVAAAVYELRREPGWVISEAIRVARGSARTHAGRRDIAAAQPYRHTKMEGNTRVQ